MPTAPNVAFLSLSRVREPQWHHDYNVWHQLDHRPENLALEGLAYGERFVLPPWAAAQAETAVPFDDFHYATVYWFDEPAGEGIARWVDLAEQTFREGRRPDLDWTDRPYMGFFRRVGTHLAPHVEVGPRALCFRPVTGLLLRITALPAEADRRALQHRHHWESRVALPALVRTPGVAGAWVLESAPDLAPAEWRSREAGHSTATAETLRVTVVATEDDPHRVLAECRTGERAETLRPPAGAPDRQLFFGALETITPWRWTWFGQAPTGPKTEP